MAMKAGKKLLSTVLFLMILGFAQEARSQQCSAGSYSVSVPSDLVVTMGDSSAIIPVTVTNNSGSTGSISYVRLDTVAFIYYISNSTAAPAGWIVEDIKNAGVGGGQTYIEFTTTTDAIAPGGSRIFYLFVTGDNNQNIPPRISGSMQTTGVDQTDSIVDDSNSTVMTIGPTKNANCFTNTGSIAQWPRRALSAVMTAQPTAVGSGGAVTLTFTVTNRSAITQATVFPNTLTISPSGGATCTGPTPASATNLQPNESATFQWSCTTSGSGGVQFCDSARNGPGTATSRNVCSAEVVAGNFTASLSISPTNVTPGQRVTVTMTLTNNGASALYAINPSLTPPSGVATLYSGPAPSTIAKLKAGTSSSITWVYTISGTIGTTFTFAGNAVATTEGLASSPATATSNIGTIVPYSVEVTPNTAYYLDTNVTFTFRVRNAGGYPVFKVRIETPSPGFVYAGALSSCMTSGEITSAPPNVTYQTADTCSCVTPARCIPCENGSCDFSVTYSQLPDVSANVNSSTDFNFHVKIWDTPLNQQNSEPRSDMGVIVKITKSGVTISVSPPSIDPGCSATVTATVSPAPAAGSVVSFALTSGELSSITTTTTGGIATATLKAPKPYDNLIAGAVVTATYQDVSASQIVTYPNNLPCASNLRRFRWQELNP